MRELMHRHPDIQDMLHDPEFMQQSLESFRNPSMMREMLRSTERAMQAIDATPGGLEMLQAMNGQIRLPSHLRAKEKGKAKGEGAAADSAGEESGKEEEPGEEKEEAAAAEVPEPDLTQAPPWADKFD